MTPVPWIVAEAVALKVATLQPRRVAVFTSDDRLTNAVADASAALHLATEICAPHDRSAVDLLVWRPADGRPTAGARRDLLDECVRSTGDVVICERVVAGCGVGMQALASIDPHLRRLTTDEIEDEDGYGLRARKSWEPAPVWGVAEAAAWRFGTDAELARGGFARRLPRIGVAEMVMMVRRILSRFDTAHELLLLALQELVRRDDLAGIDQMMRELRLHAQAPPSVKRRAAELVAAKYSERPTSEFPLAV